MRVLFSCALMPLVTKYVRNSNSPSLCSFKMHSHSDQTRAQFVLGFFVRRYKKQYLITMVIGAVIGCSAVFMGISGIVRTISKVCMHVSTCICIMCVCVCVMMVLSVVRTISKVCMHVPTCICILCVCVCVCYDGVGRC
jgi:hypothetical protein